MLEEKSENVVIWATCSLSYLSFENYDVVFEGVVLPTAVEYPANFFSFGSEGVSNRDLNGP